MVLSYVAAAGGRRVEIGVESRARAIVEKALEAGRDNLPGSLNGTDIAIRPIEREDEKLLVVNAASVNVRKRDTAESELVTQLLLGEELKGYQKINDWYLVRMADGYCGWARCSETLAIGRRTLEKYNMKVNMMVESRTVPVYSGPDASSGILAELVAGTRVAAERSENGNFLRIEFPSCTAGYIEMDGAVDISNEAPSSRRVLERAACFEGVPYLWGGTTCRGFDCSGFIRRIFDMEGVVIPRDSDLQAEAVIEVGRDSAIDELPGALLFFGSGGKINHVAISEGGGKFIHCRGMVRHDSFSNPEAVFTRSDVVKAGVILPLS